jgi:hypothetical protein
VRNFSSKHHRQIQSPDFSIYDLRFTIHKHMPEPEIARRCPTCGASIREVALFCPQCGNAQPEADSEQLQTPPVSAAVLSEPPALADGLPIGADNKPFKPPANAGGSDTPQTPKAEPAKASKGQAALGAVGAKIHQATTLARDVEGDVMHRARKVRAMSSVVLDEAGYDPSLRFVLVAVVLFVLFLIILLLNKFIT